MTKLNEKIKIKLAIQNFKEFFYKKLNKFSLNKKMSNFFTCNKWENPDSSIQTSFCVADKILLVVIVVFLIEILRQLYLYKRVHEIEWSDMRISLYSICILSLINQMIQIGVLNRD